MEYERISSYATPRDVLNKSDEDINLLRRCGLTLLYMGVESGSDRILLEINKAVTAKDMITAGQKAIRCGMQLSVTLIAGLGGAERGKEHALESAKVISEINPDYVGLLTLMIEKDTVMYDKVKSSEIVLLSPKEIMVETYEFIKNLNVSNCLFRSNHASNYLSLGGSLNRDKENLLKQIGKHLEDEIDFRDERYRAL